MSRKVKTKADLRRFMIKHSACWQAFQWVRSQEIESFKEIWDACPHIEWLVWMMRQQDPFLAEQWENYAYKKVPIHFYNPTESMQTYVRRRNLAYTKRLALLKRAYKG